MQIISIFIGIFLLVVISLLAKKLKSKPLLQKILGVIFSLLLFIPFFIKCEETIGFQIMIAAVSAILFAAILILIEFIKRPNLFSNIIIFVLLLGLVVWTFIEKHYCDKSSLEATSIAIFSPVAIAILTTIIFPLSQQINKNKMKNK